MKPNWLRDELQVFRVDADGTHHVTHSVSQGSVEIRDRVHVVGIYLATADVSLRKRLDAFTQRLKKAEKDVGFDPASNREDLGRLRSYVTQ